MSVTASAQSIRQAIFDSLPEDTSAHGHAADARYVYVPPSHIKALRLENNLVVGGRGVGKSFWAAALSDEAVRGILGSATPILPARLVVRAGYGERHQTSAYPEQDLWQSLLVNGVQPYDIWRAIISRWLSGLIGDAIPSDTWSQTVGWVRDNPEPYARLLEAGDRRFSARNENGLIVFDALDRVGRDWVMVDRIVRDLLRIVLALKPFRRLAAKVFLREDQARETVFNFPDASKILASQVELSWGFNDLHGLLWQYLCNGPNSVGAMLRDHYARNCPDSLKQDSSGAWQLPDTVKRQPELQRKLFESLAGEWMGKDRRRGFPYSWIVGHLADGRGRSSPRSFLAAIRRAAEDSIARYHDYHQPLHYESIKRGVQSASAIRVNELAEDYPWVKDLMKPLDGLTVPCEFQRIENLWESQGFLKDTLAGFDTGSILPPPARLTEGWSGLRADLEELGIFERMRDQRVNMPDLYRVGFGLGRMGGVKPIMRSRSE